MQLRKMELLQVIQSRSIGMFMEITYRELMIIVLLILLLIISYAWEEPLMNLPIQSNKPVMGIILLQAQPDQMIGMFPEITGRMIAG